MLLHADPQFYKIKIIVFYSLQFPSTCDSWLDWVNHNRTASEQHEIFESNIVVKKMLDDLSVRLGVNVTLGNFVFTEIQTFFFNRYVI